MILILKLKLLLICYTMCNTCYVTVNFSAVYEQRVVKPCTSSLSETGLHKFAQVLFLLVCVRIQKSKTIMDNTIINITY